MANRMENPATWTPAEWVIADAIEQHAALTAAGVVGCSLPRAITRALAEAGYVVRKAEEVP